MWEPLTYPELTLNRGGWPPLLRVCSCSRSRTTAASSRLDYGQAMQLTWLRLAAYGSVWAWRGNEAHRRGEQVGR